MVEAHEAARFAVRGLGLNRENMSMNRPGILGAFQARGDSIPIGLLYFW